MDETVEFYKNLLGEERITLMNASLPQEPGEYEVDGELWTLHENGEWEDATGDSRPADWNFVLVMTGFNPIKVDA